MPLDIAPFDIVPFEVWELTANFQRLGHQNHNLIRMVDFSLYELYKITYTYITCIYINVSTYTYIYIVRVPVAQWGVFGFLVSPGPTFSMFLRPPVGTLGFLGLSWGLPGNAFGVWRVGV